MFITEMKHNCIVLAIMGATAFLLSCNRQVEAALGMAGANRSEMESVLDHFRDDPDPLRYEAAQFLIENMPYRHCQGGSGTERVDSAYLAMAAYSRASRSDRFKTLTENIDTSQDTMAVDIRCMKAGDLISSIDQACSIWRSAPWSTDYADSTFFDYVLPYRLLDEPLSDWREKVRAEYPELFREEVRSKRGQLIEAEDMTLTSCKPARKVGASCDKHVLLEAPGASASFRYNSQNASTRNLQLRYTSQGSSSARALLFINGILTDTIRLTPADNPNTFRTSRRGTDIQLRPGDNDIRITYAGDTLGIDYVMVGGVEACDEGHLPDFSSCYCRMRNVGTGGCVAFDTLRSSLLDIMTLAMTDMEDSCQLLRFDYRGHASWSIAAFKSDTADLCMEVQYVRTNPDAPISQYTYTNGPHQKWAILPAGTAYRLMNRDTGLFLEAKLTDDPDSIALVQNPLSGDARQLWVIKPEGQRSSLCAEYGHGTAKAAAMMVYDEMGQFEWVGASTGSAPKASSLLEARTGNCRDEALYTALLCRSIGVPAAVDFTPHWGNRSLAHLWSVIILPGGKGTPFYMGCTPGDTIHYFHSYLKPKVLRHRFSLNMSIASDMKEETSVPRLFMRPAFTDVTDEYYETTDVVRPVPARLRNRKVAYICVFDNRDWVPVYYGKIAEGKVTFPKMGRNIMYIAATYEDGRVKPFGTPFFVCGDGTVKGVTASKKSRCTMRLLRKYPFMGKEDFFNSRMSGGRFQGANRADFVNSADLHKHEGLTDGNWYDVPVKDERRYRYLRYIGPGGSHCNINELAFYDEYGKQIEGDIIGTEGEAWASKEKVFDGDILTGFSGISPDGHWVGLRLKKPARVSRIRYIPRNDGNGIEIGDKYELYYWHDDQWELISEQVAKANELTVRNAPSGGLYVLRNVTKGHEERIFTYDKKKGQIWW